MLIGFVLKNAYFIETWQLIKASFLVFIIKGTSENHSVLKSSVVQCQHTIAQIKAKQLESLGHSLFSS